MELLVLLVQIIATEAGNSHYDLKFTIMKIKYLNILSLFVLLAVFGCSDDEDFDYEGVYPVVLDGIQGAEEVNQTFTSTFTLDYDRGGSTWTWSAEDATVQSVSDDTRTAVVLFSELPADGVATIYVYETTEAGVQSETVSLDVAVNEYCALDNGNSDLVGTWSGTDYYSDSYTYDSQVVTSDATDDGVTIKGLNFGWIAGYWGEEIQSGGDAFLSVYEDGTVEIESQDYFTTLWSGSPYSYVIEGSGTWSNCGSTPEVTIEYTISYSEEDGGSSVGTFTATLALEE